MPAGMKSFLLDTAMDDNVRLIRAQFGNQGFANLILLWMKLYREEGYWMRWDEDAKNLFTSEEGRWDKGKLDRMISVCMMQGLFSSEKYQQYSVLTSAAIQKRYFKYKNRSQPYEVEKNLLLYPEGIDVYKNIIIVCRKFKNADSFKTTRLDQIRLDKEEDIAVESAVLDYQSLSSKMNLMVRRSVDAYGPESQKAFSSMQSKIVSIASAIKDPEVIDHINNCSNDKLYQLWYTAQEIIHPIADDVIASREIENRDGYLYQTIINLFRRAENGK